MSISNCNNKWYCQIDGLAMGASLAVILANIWMKSFEDRLKEESCVQEQGLEKDPSDKCPDCSRKLVWNSKGVECERCKNWFHAKCQKISNEEYRKMGDIVWFCSHCCQLPEKTLNVERKFFARYVDDIVCTTKSTSKELLEKVNSLHKNLQFTLENVDENGELAFLDMSICVNKEKNISCKWYRKPTDTSTILNFRSCAPLQHKKNIIQGTVHRLFRCTSDWKSFDEALKTNQEIWFKNQYPESWTARIVNETLETLIVGKQKLKDNTSVENPTEKRKHDDIPTFLMQYRGNLSVRLKQKLQKISRLNVIFTTRKLKTCVPSLKSSFDKDLKSHVVYEISCSGCESTYVGQTCRHVTTRIAEHQKLDSPVGLHVSNCCGAAKAFTWRVIDQSTDTEKLITIEALHIRQRKPKINTRDEYRGRELTLKY